MLCGIPAGKALCHGGHLPAAKPGISITKLFDKWLSLHFFHKAFKPFRGARVIINVPV
jgi:hypothetical protein